jgi:Protein of unknown function (DUF2786)
MPTNRLPYRPQRKPRAPKQAGAAGETNVDACVLKRIKKCLDRAHHDPNTSKIEAQAALYMSSRLRTQHNVSQAYIVRKVSALGGESTVAITSTESAVAKVIMHRWVERLIKEVGKSFSCKTYSVGCSDEIVVAFCGIPRNTVNAAKSFEKAYNLTLERKMRDS